MAWDLEAAKTNLLASGAISEVQSALSAASSNALKVAMPFAAIEMGCEKSLDDEGKLSDLIAAVAMTKGWQYGIYYLTRIVEFYE